MSMCVMYVPLYGIIFIMRGLLRCSFSRNGQCEGLEVRDEQSNPRFFMPIGDPWLI